ncbi:MULTISPECIES: P52 family lipoprotein [Borreliella]|uniref:P52 family lipoprotein n=1 Tax=Borreliella TaxID=64895 RepID=UPI002E2E87A3|nr:P52 family lipoprotein [Borreliella bavariensis]
MKNGTQEIPPLTDYNEEYFNKFFLSLGSDRSKELIKFFGRVKNERNDRFKHAVFWLYFMYKGFVFSRC